MPAPKFNFIPERQINEVGSGNGCWRVSLLNSKASPTIYFPKDMVYALDMDGKHFQIFADVEKKAIGWREVKGKTELETVKNSRKFTKNKASGVVLIGIGKILKALNYDLKESISNILVNRYESPLVIGEISYIILPNESKEEKETDGK